MLQTRGKRRDGRHKQNVNVIERSDLQIMAAVIILSIYGLMMIFSASAYSSAGSGGKFAMYELTLRQLACAIGGMVVLAVCRVTNYHIWEKLSSVIYVLGIFLIFALKTPLGVEVNHAVRWVKVCPYFNLQVADVVKAAVIVWIAAQLKQHCYQMDRPALMVRIWIGGCFPAVLIWQISTDLSSALVIVGITFGMTFLYCTYTKIHVILMGSAVVGVFVWRKMYMEHLPTAEELANMSFRKVRLAVWLDPERYASGKGYQTMQALYAVGSGGITGKGIGNGVQKLSKIPEAQNDMIFSVICEELGVIGSVILLFLFGYLVFQLVKLALSCHDTCGTALVIGVALQIILQVVVNVCVCLNLFPNTGISLPFISYGGSSILLLLAEIGIVLSVYREMQQKAVIQYMQKNRGKAKLS